MVISRKNQGQGVARNKALEIAKGDYVIFVDPDDWIESDMLQILNNKFSETKAEVIQFNYREINEHSKKVRIQNLEEDLERRKNKFKLENNSFYSQNDLNEDSKFLSRLAIWDKAYKLKFLKENNIFFAPNKHAEDTIFRFKVLFKAAKIFYINNIFYNYLCRPNSAVNELSDDNFCIFDNIEAVKNFLISEKIYDEGTFYKQYIWEILKDHYNKVLNKPLFEKECLKFATGKEYKKLIKYIRHKNSFMEEIFSLKNENKNGIKHKIMTVLGFKFDIS